MGVLGQDSAQSLWLGLRNRPAEELRPLAGIAVGLLLGLISLVVYIAGATATGCCGSGSRPSSSCSVAFWFRSRALPRIALADVGIAGGLVALASPLYLLVLFRWPVQVSSDETTVMDVSKTVCARRERRSLRGQHVPHRGLRGSSSVWGKLGS